MKISYNWLKSYVDFSYSPEELLDILTALGLEIGKIEKIGGIEGGLKGVVVGHVLEAEQHPSADRLRVCKVDVGQDEPLQIVCGAPNVAAGQKVPVATIGTVLPTETGEPFKIKKGKIRGEVSFGMICAEDELGLGTNHEGIMVLAEDVTVGADFIDTLDLDEDYTLEVELTPNRVDGASHYGVARDLAAYMRSHAILPETDLGEGHLEKENPISVSIEDSEKCQRYTSLYIEGITVTESPDWLKERLLSIGLRPINNIVDITNYVLMELGHPLHAFDADTLKDGKIVVRTAGTDQKFTTLDEIERDLIGEKDLMICDAERPLCVAEVMGGLNSGVTEKTTNIFLESAYFEAGTVRRTAKRLGLSTDSSYRFERGVDPHMTVTAALRAAKLIVDIAGGTVSQISDQQLQDFPHFEVDYSVAAANKMFGQEITKEDQVEILKALEVEVTEDADGDTLHLLIPPYRVDVKRPQDVMEDVLRVYGFNNIQIPSKVNMSLNFRQYRDTFGLRQRYCDYLSANGFYEIMNNSLVHANLGDEKAVPMLNPLSEDLGIMRQSMLPSILATIEYNQNRQNEDLAIYEFGRTYDQSANGYQEKEWLALAISGAKHPQHFEAKAPKASLFTLTKEVERLLSWFKLEGKTKECEHADFDYGLEVIIQRQPVLRYGKINAELEQKYSLRNEVFYMLIDWEKLADLYFQSEVQFAPIPVYPAIRRDVSMLVDETVSFQEIKQLVKKANPKLIRSVDLHDVYKGKGIPEGKKSYLISIVLRDDKKTLEDKAAEKVTKRIFGSLENQIGAEIRK